MFFFVMSCLLMPASLFSAAAGKESALFEKNLSVVAAQLASLERDQMLLNIAKEAHKYIGLEMFYATLSKVLVSGKEGVRVSFSPRGEHTIKNEEDEIARQLDYRRITLKKRRALNLIKRQCMPDLPNVQKKIYAAITNPSGVNLFLANEMLENTQKITSLQELLSSLSD